MIGMVVKTRGLDAFAAKVQFGEFNITPPGCRLPAASRVKITQRRRTTAATAL